MRIGIKRWLVLLVLAIALAAVTGYSRAPGSGLFSGDEVAFGDLLDPASVTALLVRCGATGSSAVTTDPADVQAIVGALDPARFTYSSDQALRAGYQYYVDLRLVGSETDYLRICPLGPGRVSLSSYAGGEVRWSAYYETDRDLLAPVRELAERLGLTPDGG